MDGHPDSELTGSPTGTSEVRHPVGPPTRKPFPWKWVAAGAILVGLLALAVRDIDFHRFAATIAASRWPLVAAAAAIALTVCMFACSLRLWLLTLPLPIPPGRRHISLADMTSVYLASSAGHHLLPAPGAEVLRTVHLKRRYGYSIAALVASQVVDRVIDALGLGLEIAVVALVGELPRAIHVSLGLFAVATLGGVGAIVVVAARHGRRRALGLDADVSNRGPIAAFIERLGEGVWTLRHPRIWVASLACSIVNDIANATTVGLCAAAAGVTLSPSAWFVAVLVARLAGLLPSTPGQFGVVEAGLVAALAAFGVDQSVALAVAVLYHAAHFAPITLVGLWELRRQLQPVRETETGVATPVAPVVEEKT